MTSEPLKLWIDGQCLQTHSRMRGIGRYVLDLLRSLSTHENDIELQVSLNAAMADSAMAARSLLADIVPAERIHVWHGKAEGGEADFGFTPWRKRSEIALVHHVNQLNPDVALSASPFEGALDPAVPYLGGPLATVRTAAIFYDAIPFRFPDKYMRDPRRQEYFNRRLSSYRDFDLAFTISDFSSGELRHFVNTTNDLYIGTGISNRFVELIDDSTERNDIAGEYLLYVGGFDWRKNIAIVPAALCMISKPLREKLKFVIAGDVGPVEEGELRNVWASCGLPADGIVFAGAVDDRTLVGLYKEALALVQPSFMEGFGLTALEAIACGTPAIAARAGALPEIVGDDALLFDPASPSDLAEKIEAVAVGKPNTRKLKELARDRIDAFSWSRVSERVVEGLRGLERRPAPPPRFGLVEALAVRKDEERDVATLMALAEPELIRPRLLVDASSTLIDDGKSGIQRVVRRICENMFPRRAKNEGKYISFCDDESGWYFAREWTGRAPPKQPSTRLLPQAGDTILMLDSSWIYHTLHPAFLRPALIKGGEVISCLYDTVPLRSAAFCHEGMPPAFSAWFQTALAYSTGFVCISRAVADELLDLLAGIRFPRPMKVGYWQLGADFAKGPTASKPARASTGAMRPRFLMVGTLEPRKGHRVALDAFEALWADGFDIELIIVGKTGWGTAYLDDRIRRHAEFGKRLHLHSQVDDGDLATLYTGCDALIAASFAEGFGLPIVEAGHFGKPVIASDIPVFREVGKGAAAASFFEAGSAAALGVAVKDFLNSTATAKTGDASWPTWSESATQLEDVVVGQKWYKLYEPKDPRPLALRTDLGTTRVMAPLEEEQRAHRLEFVEGPCATDDGAALKIVVNVTNLSDTVWSSLCAADGQLGVTLSYHALDAAGQSIQYNNARTNIPFVLVPGDTIYLAVNVPMSLKNSGTEFVEIELVQEGNCWFGNPLRVAL
ncbi:MAG: glycosyltransferase [Mesorhizobium sp.]|uniref:glycosyltransferase family 4 protein n=1 Tax=unclassified Mesorhizobium TaxID=325217 RepID=UPI000F764671|nr:MULTISPECIES: glycosyltransferase family 1 protein [unclassified Mesorhizobium]AZO48395.1 glycosyltransferase family 1 protein [Mesorhizobium sp. M4B.F.Ca.ET.058.02.1.1]RVC44721.1 glycosyltransferase [Mesorhizobium sp. M4A.F.Ca.ET.090.04.2.1]RWD15417.1 MAG: glycosyltransferase [Mesorhizobium sp.]RWD56655.1 MAG: glycosyltransferase [Mesorhizobium sp.]TIW13623.1 MAG: glycosyltransferase [Mesorhizobium sp.]